MTLPHDALRKARDRSWTPRLLAALTADPDDEERDEIVRSLSVLADPRLFAPLTALLEDPRAPTAVREAAGGLLRDQAAPHPRDARRAWWRSGDPVLEAHAIASMDRADAELLEPVAADDAHPLQSVAIRSLSWGFQATRFQRLKIRALDHRDPVVRQAACDALLWDEPVAAEEGLLRAAHDPVDDVAVAAIQTLRYYTSRRTLTALHGLCSSTRAELRREARDSLNEAQGSFWGALEQARGAASERLRAWMSPVWSIVAYEPEPEDEDADEVRPSPRVPDRPSPTEIEAAYGDLDGPWGEKMQRLYGIDWSAYDADAQARITALLCSHEDPEVRGASCKPLSLWGARDVLLSLLDDPSFPVMKSAMYWLGQMASPSVRVAERAWVHLHAPATESTHAYETLETYARHAPRQEAVPRLVHLALHDERESVVVHAIHTLRRLGAHGELAGLAGLLTREPAITWATHIALLDALIEPPPQARDLASVDDLWLQASLARFAR